MYERHTAKVIATKAVLYPSWKDTIIDIATDDKRKITSHVSGVVTLFQNVGFIWIWSCAHQLLSFSVPCMQVLLVAKRMYFLRRFGQFGRTALSRCNNLLMA